MKRNSRLVGLIRSGLANAVSGRWPDDTSPAIWPGAANSAEIAPWASGANHTAIGWPRRASSLRMLVEQRRAQRPTARRQFDGQHHGARLSGRDDAIAYQLLEIIAAVGLVEHRLAAGVALNKAKLVLAHVAVGGASVANSDRRCGFAVLVDDPRRLDRQRCLAVCRADVDEHIEIIDDLHG